MHERTPGEPVCAIGDQRHSPATAPDTQSTSAPRRPTRLIILRQIAVALPFIFLLYGCGPGYRFSPLHYPALPVPEVQTIPCSYDAAWEMALSFLVDYPLLYADKTHGILTTDFVPSISYQNLYHKDMGSRKKYGYFAYTLHGHPERAIVVYIEAGSPAADLLLPGDIILNYDRNAIQNSDTYLFHIRRKHQEDHIRLRKKRFLTSFSEFLVPDARLRINLRLSKAKEKQTVIRVSLQEEQFSSSFNPRDRVLSIGNYVPLDDDGYKKSLIFNYLAEKGKVCF